MDTVDPAWLWRVQLALQGSALDGAGQLADGPGVHPDELASCYIVGYARGGQELAFSQDAPGWFVDRLRRIGAEACLAHPDRAARGIRRDDVTLTVVRSTTYRFVPPVATVAGAASLVRVGSEHVSAMVNGSRVAEASASRTNDQAAELWVFTEPAHRRRGYASQAATTWAKDVTEAGKVAFYSHLRSNRSSARLATSLGLTPLLYLVDFAVRRSEHDLESQP